MLAPSVSHPPASPAGSALGVLARQAILDSKGAIFGYTLLPLSLAPASASRDAAMLLHALSLNEGTEQADRRPLFVALTHETLASGHLDLVDPKRLVLDVGPVAASQMEAATLTLKALRNRGFRIAFDHRILAAPWYSWLPLASFVRIDMARLDGTTATAAVAQVQRQGGSKLIACNVETTAQNARAFALGADMFQGSWFTQTVPAAARSMRPGQATIIQLMNLVRNEASIDKIEEVLKRDTALSFHLLRFVNYSGYGICEVTSFRQAVLILGLKKLFRWAALLMAVAGNAAPAIGQTALVRGRLMELLASELLPPEQRDDAFVVGIFSLLDTMLGMPMAQALDCVSLPQTVTDALLHQRGLLAPLLHLTRACESGDADRLTGAADALLLGEDQVNAVHLQALAWADTLLQ